MGHVTSPYIKQVPIFLMYERVDSRSFKGVLSFIFHISGVTATAVGHGRQRWSGGIGTS